jgi:hypothetical protein
MCGVQVCQHVPVYREPESGLSPTDLAARLTSIASSIHFRRDDQVGPITPRFRLQMTSQNLWNMSLFEHFFKGLSLNLNARIWIRIWICMGEKSDPDPHQDDKSNPDLHQ